MRSQSGPRNRFVLFVLGVLALVAAAWLAAAAFDLVPAGGTLDPLVPDGASTPASLLEDAGWALPVGIAVSVVAVLAGLALLISQIPTVPTRAVLRLHDPEGAVLATLEPQVLERALVERVEDVQGVDSASVRATGSATRAGVVAEVTVAESAEIAWTLAQVRHRLFEDLRLSLGSEPRSVDVLCPRRCRCAARSGRFGHYCGGRGRRSCAVPCRASARSRGRPGRTSPRRAGRQRPCRTDFVRFTCLRSRSATARPGTPLEGQLMTDPVNNPDYSGQYAPGQSYQHPYPAAQSPASVPAPYGTAQPPAAMGLLFKERSPIMTWLVFPIITLGIYVYVWYYKIHKEMAEFDRRRQVPVAGPALVLFFLGWTVIAPLVSFYNTGQRIQNAQRASGLQPTCSPILSCLLTFVFGLNILYMQSELNKIVDRYPGAPEGAQVPLYV